MRSENIVPKGRNMKRLQWLILSSLTALTLVACPEVPDPNAVATITVAPASLNLEVGQSVGPLLAVAQNANGDTLTGKTFTWNSSDPSIATVTAEGRVTALKGGSVNITSSSEGKQGRAGLNISFTLRIGATTYGNNPVTVFVSKADGSLINSKTVNPLPDQRGNNEVLEFPDLPGDALVTAAYQVSKPVGGASGTYTRLSTIPASYANGRGYFFVNNYEYLGSLYAKLDRPEGLNAVFVRRFLPENNTEDQYFGNGDARDLTAQFSYNGFQQTYQQLNINFTDAASTTVKACAINTFTNLKIWKGIAITNPIGGDYASIQTCSVRRADGADLGNPITFSNGNILEIEMGGLGFYKVTITENTPVNGTVAPTAKGLAKPYVAPFQNVYTYDLQKNGLYSALFVAYDVNKNPIAYKFLKNRTMPGSGLDTLEVKANEWQTDLTQTVFMISNVGTGWTGYYCPSLFGYIGGIYSASAFDCNNNNTVPGTYTFNRKFVPGFEKYGFTFGNIAEETYNAPGAPSRISRLEKRDLNTLPASVNLDFSTDFMPFPIIGALSSVGTPRPGVSWIYGGDTSKLEQVTAYIFERDKKSGNDSVQQPGIDYYWDLRQLPTMLNTVKFPELPSSISAYAPIEGTRNYRINVNLQEKATSSYRYVQLSRNLNEDSNASTANSTLGEAALRQKSVPQSGSELKTDQFSIVLK
jgi:Bacterial Ig-like domain (group 2)